MARAREENRLIRFEPGQLHGLAGVFRFTLFRHSLHTSEPKAPAVQGFNVVLQLPRSNVAIVSVFFILHQIQIRISLTASLSGVFAFSSC